MDNPPENQGMYSNKVDMNADASYQSPAVVDGVIIATSIIIVMFIIFSSKVAYSFYIKRVSSRQVDDSKTVGTEDAAYNASCIKAADSLDAVKRKLHLILHVARNKMLVQDEDILQPASLFSQGSEIDLEFGTKHMDEITNNELRTTPSCQCDKGSLIQDTNRSIDGLCFVRVPRMKTFVTLPDRRLVANHCSICRTPYAKGHTLVWSSSAFCGHVFHDDCVLRYFSETGISTCPICDEEIVDKENLMTVTSSRLKGIRHSFVCSHDNMRKHTPVMRKLRASSAPNISSGNMLSGS